MKPSFYSNHKPIIFIVLAGIVSCGSDLVMQHLSTTICPYHILLIKYGITLIGALIIQGYYLKRPLSFNFSSRSRWRSLIIFGAMTLWCYGLNGVSLPTITAISFCTPFMALIWARVILKERVHWREFVTIAFCLVGVMLCVGFERSENAISLANLIGATVLFSYADCQTKALSQIESPLEAVVSIASICSGLSLISGFGFSSRITYYDMGLLIMLGILNLILTYSLIAAYQLAFLKTLVPWKYTELVISIALSAIIYNSYPSKMTIMGIMIICGTQLFIFFKKNL